MGLVCALIYRALGWTIEGRLPDEPKAVIVAYPHTSNWDFFVFLAVIGHLRVKVRFLAHEGLFVGPFGWLLRRLGGIPVRPGAGTAVDAAVAMFERSETMLLVLAPEGTRRGGAWKPGFWRIAEAADVPVVMGFYDRATKRMGVGPARRIDGDPEAWMDGARRFYEGMRGHKPQNQGPVELR